MKAVLSFLIASLVLAGPLAAQQTPDFSYVPVVDNPEFTAGTGPLVLVDQAHNNFHTAGGRFAPFARVLRAEGYRVDSLEVALFSGSLERADILVIANALHESNLGNWVLPTPSAFSDEEIDEVYHWVSQGGSLLLLADHMPFPGAAGKLAARFGFEFNNGFAMRDDGQGVFSFTTSSENKLLDHAITRGRSEAERVDSVVTFTGQAFKAPRDAEPLMVFGPGYETLMPERAWQFEDDTKRVPLDGWVQGAVLHVGKGRIAVFGEAAEFSAQVLNGFAFGINSPVAPQNQRFLRNVMLWLARRMD